MPLVPPPRLQCRRGEPGSLAADAGHSGWRDAESVLLRENVTGVHPPQVTRVRSVWNDEAWCLLFESEDTYPWATLTERDGPLWTEEVVEVFLDPFGDLQSYFEVEINSLGTVVDLVLRRTASGWRKDFTWQVEGLGSATRRTAGGWAAELRIPFASVAAGTPRIGENWRANFLRIDRPEGPGSEGVLSAWSPTGMRNFHRPEFFGTVEFAA